MDKQKQIELKPCPFCGSTSLKVESKHNGQWSYTGTHSVTVRCNKCHARGSTASRKVRGTYNEKEATIQKAIELWNTRAGGEKIPCKHALKDEIGDLYCGNDKGANWGDFCVCCGADIPEGRQVCPNCEKE